MRFVGNSKFFFVRARYLEVFAFASLFVTEIAFISQNSDLSYTKV